MNDEIPCCFHVRFLGIDDFVVVEVYDFNPIGSMDGIFILST